MVFKNEAELKKYILAKCKNAIIKSQAQVYQIIDRFVKQFYVEFTPEMYERTYQLFRSLVKGDIVSTSNGYEAYVYFDVDMLDHYVHTIRVKKSNGKTYTYSYSGKHDWSEQDILNNAMTGSSPHGGYADAGGQPIWVESLEVLSTEAIEVLKRMLISEGIPIKKK